MKLQGAITNVKRPANGDNFGKASIEHVLMSYPKRLDAYIPDAGEVVAVVSSKWMEGKGGGKNWVALEMKSCATVGQQSGAGTWQGQRFWSTMIMTNFANGHILDLPKLLPPVTADR